MAEPSPLEFEWAWLAERVSSSLDLDESAYRTGALVRRREIRSGEMLLRLALAYGPGGLSLRRAATWAGIHGLGDLSDTAVLKRLRGAGDWLGEIAGALLQGGRTEKTSPSFLPGRRLRIVDASVFTQPGSQGVDWRLHASYDPATGRFVELDLTGRREAESFRRIDWAAGEVGIGDCCYARPFDLQTVINQQADFIVRIGHASLRLLQEDGALLSWEALFQSVPADAHIERTVTVEKAGKGLDRRGEKLFSARLIVRRVSPKAAERAKKKLGRKHRKSALQPLTLQAADFLMILTSLPPDVEATEVLAAYRLRWQVELAFKRLKSLLKMDRLPAKCPKLARSWLLAHLVLALLIEDTAQDLLDSPPSASRIKAWDSRALAINPNPA